MSNVKKGIDNTNKKKNLVKNTKIWKQIETMEVLASLQIVPLTESSSANQSFRL